MSKRLYVGNLSFDTTEAEIREHFGRLGTVSEVKVMMDGDTGRPRGFAFVEMGTDAEAHRAIAQLAGQKLAGRALKVNQARERESVGGDRSHGNGGLGHY